MTPFLQIGGAGGLSGVGVRPACLVLRRTSVSRNSFPRVTLQVARRWSPIVLGSSVLVSQGSTSAHTARCSEAATSGEHSLCGPNRRNHCLLGLGLSARNQSRV